MKITSGKYKGQIIKTPNENIVRPTLSKMREAVFNVLFSHMDFSDKSFLDMYAGSGIMGLEAMSRGFEYICAIEKNFKVAQIIKENFEKLDADIELIVGDSLKKISQIQKKFDVIYIDPPYYSGIYEKTLECIAANRLLNTTGIVVMEHVVDIKWKSFGYTLIKQKKYSQKMISFLHKSDK